MQAQTSHDVLIIGPGSEWFWAMAQFFAVALSFAFIVRQIRLQSHANVLSSFQQFDDRWSSDALLQARAELGEKADSSFRFGNAEEAVAMFFERLGLYLKMDVFKIEMVWELYSFYIEHYWAILGPHIEGLRQDDPSMYTQFEALRAAVQRCTERQQCPGLRARIRKRFQARPPIFPTIAAEQIATFKRLEREMAKSARAGRDMSRNASV